jgi:signal transduction histidine kinase
MRSRRRVALVALLAALALLSGAAGVVFDRLLVHAGRPDLVGLQGENWIIVAGIVSSAVVGASVALARPHNPVGWLFLALSVLMMSSGPLDGWADYGLVAKPGSLPGADLVAYVEDRTFIGWLVLVALVLYLTPTGRPLSPRWGLAARATAVSGAVAFVLGLVTERPLPAPYQHAGNPLEVSAVQPAADIVAIWLVLVVGIGLVLGGVSLLVRFRRSEGDDRRQLLWMAFVVVPLPLFVIAAFVAANLDNDAVTVIASGGFVTLIPVAAGLSVVRYRLYDVERLLAATITYVLLTAVLVLTYGFIVWLGARGFQAWDVSPAVSATIGAIVAAALAAPLRRGLQDEIDRRFNRRQFDARQVIRDGLADEDAGVDLEQLFRRAFADDHLTLAYPGPDPDTWVAASGLSPRDTSASVDVQRRGRVIARIGFDPARTDPGTISAGAALASAELDNGRLLAEQARQLAEIGASRRRLAGAQRRERRRIERDLHDGAQQSLLALAFELQSAQLSGDEARMRQALSEGAEAARGAVRELRALANGLHPAALADGGLSAALDDLARHSTVPLLVDADVPRLAAALEFTAWLVIGEAVVNVQKHANATCIRVGASVADGMLRLCVADDGEGGANPDGPGLRGLRDRVETARGTLRVRSAPGAGTTIEAVLPCAS